MTHSRKFQDLTGRRFGRWTVLGLAARASETCGISRWNVRCDCGMEKTVWRASLIGGSSKSCGCWKKLPRPYRVKHHCSREERSRVYRDRYREDGRTNRRAREWRKANPEAAKLVGVLAAQKRRARESAAPGNGVTKADWAEICEVFGNACAYCLGPATAMDHLVPLVGGGAHDPSNIVPACKSCNSSKHKHSLLTFVSRGGGVV